MNGFSENEGLDNSFYPEFYNEGLYLVKERVEIPQNAYGDSVRQNLNEGLEKESSALPFNDLKRPETLLLFNYTAGQDISEADRTFVAKVLEAVKQQFAEAEKINVNTASLKNWDDVLNASEAEYILAFDIPAELLPAGIEMGKPVTVQGRKVVSLDSLSTIAANISLKKLLWEGLKQMYQV